LGLIILFANKNNQKISERLIKYFIIQVIASILLLLFFIINFWLFIFFPLLVKIGAVPFHFWLIPVLKNLNYYNIFILLVLQKIVPLVLLLQVNIHYLLLCFLCLVNALIGSVIGIFQTAIKNIIGYSSIHHIGWLLIAQLINKTMVLFYLFFYGLLLFPLIKLCSYFNVKNLQDTLKFSSSFKIILIILILSLAGLPPFLGFLPK
jgi:NADH-quinone oxidoreductase subunit N